MTTASELRVLSWNLFHGRDFPPDAALFTRRSRLLRRTEDNGVHLQVNRSLAREFALVLSRAEWSVCLLQEAPPSWSKLLADRCGAAAARTLTSRNALRPLTSPLARWNPDLIGSWEGGSNLILVRPPWRIVGGSRRSLLLNPLRERGAGERRRMVFARIRLDGTRSEAAVANLHASTGPRGQIERELWRAASAAVRWAAGAPLVFGGDFNLRPDRAPELYERLERELGLEGPTDRDAIDHLLTRDLAVVEPPRRWPPERRELEVDTPVGPRRLRLSDHAPVEAVVALPSRWY